MLKNMIRKIGLISWILQRLSAVMMASYLIFLLHYLWVHHPLTYENWHLWFSQSVVKIYSVITIISLLIHTWIGMWTITTDYVHGLYTRTMIHSMVLILLSMYGVWGIQILWDIARVYS
jgi:succinate dehydrogenase / fumarate reductase membrane anchor subunit